MSRAIGRSRYVWGTYPERSNGIGGGGAGDLPLSTIAFVDYGTTTPLPSQNGFIGTPFATVQQALDAGFTSVYIDGNGGEDVVAPGSVYLTGMDGQAVLNSLTLPDNAFARITKCQIATLTAGNTCDVLTDSSIDTSVFGTDGLFTLNGPGALTFGVGLDQLRLGNVTMGAAGGIVATFADFSSGHTVVASAVHMFGCSSSSDMNVGSIDAQDCKLPFGTYTTTGKVALQNVLSSAGVAFHNALGQPFDLDGFSNYWIKTNAVTLSHVGQKVITDDLTP